MKTLKNYINAREAQGMSDEPVSIGESTLYGLIDLVKDLNRRVDALEVKSKVSDNDMARFFEGLKKK